jgi:hypothetical protein
VLDRASTFADSEIVAMLQKDFVPVAIDQGGQRRQNDPEGDFYRRIAGQGPRSDFQSTTQGLYIADASGKLIAYNNNRGPERIRRLMREALEGFSPPRVQPIADGTLDSKFHPVPPEGGLVVRVHAKILRGYAAPRNEWEKIFQSAIARDNLWITATEREALVRGKFSDVLAERIARFHLVDNTRGEPPMWTRDDLKLIRVALVDGRIRGPVELRTPTGSRGYLAELAGIVEVAGGQVTRFDLVAQGDYWGHGPYTSGPPEGKFPLAVSFRLADGSDAADEIPPEGSRFWVDGYLRPK